MPKYRVNLYPIGQITRVVDGPATPDEALQQVVAELAATQSIETPAKWDGYKHDMDGAMVEPLDDAGNLLEGPEVEDAYYDPIEIRQITGLRLDT